MLCRISLDDLKQYCPDGIAPIGLAVCSARNNLTRLWQAFHSFAAAVLRQLESKTLAAFTLSGAFDQLIAERERLLPFPDSLLGVAAWRWTIELDT